MADLFTTILTLLGLVIACVIVVCAAGFAFIQFLLYIQDGDNNDTR
jgi:hypothetical protein